MRLTKMVALILAAAILCIGLVPAAGAEGSYYEEQKEKYEAMQKRTIGIQLDHEGLYALKSEKFYYREVMGLAYDGQFQISGWKCINNPNSSFRLPGTAVIFGYSFDILAGTDWPYSGCFWGWDKQDIPVNDINIYIDGLCRLAGIYIYVNKDLIYNEFNCDSHSEWRPC